MDIPTGPVEAAPHDPTLNTVGMQLNMMQHFSYTLHQWHDSQAIMHIALSVPTQDDMIVVHTYAWHLKRNATEPHKVYGRLAPIWLCKRRGWYYDYIKVEDS